MTTIGSTLQDKRVLDEIYVCREPGRLLDVLRDGFDSFKGNFADGGGGSAPSIGSLSDNSEQLVLQNPTLEFSRSYTTSVLRTTIPDKTLDIALAVKVAKMKRNRVNDIYLPPKRVV